MVWYVLIGALAAFGLLCALWVLFGSLLMRVRTVAILCDGQEMALIRRYFWLRQLGLTKCRLVLLNSHLSAQYQSYICQRCNDIEFYTLAQWCAGEREVGGH